MLADVDSPGRPRMTTKKEDAPLSTAKSCAEERSQALPLPFRTHTSTELLASHTCPPVGAPRTSGQGHADERFGQSQQEEGGFHGQTPKSQGVQNKSGLRLGGRGF